MTGRECQAIRTRLGLSLTALGSRLGRTGRAIHEWERLNKEIPWRIAPRLALVFLQARAEALQARDNPRPATPGKWGGTHTSTPPTHSKGQTP